MINTDRAPSVSTLPQTGAQPDGPRSFTLLEKLRGVVVLLLLASVLFVSAERWDVPAFWTYWIVFSAFGVITLRLVHRKHPELLQERFRPGPGGRDPWTRPVLVVLFAGHWIVAGLDVGRFHWSDAIPTALQLSALVVMALGLAGWGWAMLNNRFFSSEVRIQNERGHQVETGGPYRFVRHPGYAAALLVFAASPLALGSLWAALPIAAVELMFVRRTALEDGMLRAELPGYAEYAARVRFRLLPGVW